MQQQGLQQDQLGQQATQPGLAPTARA
jgi:hypothetical protein